MRRSAVQLRSWALETKGFLWNRGAPFLLMENDGNPTFADLIDGKLMETPENTTGNNQSGKATCKLCLERPTHPRSHVVPEFLLKWTYDEKQRFHYIRLRENGSPEIHQIQKMSEAGIDYDPGLLCRSCEELFNPWETYCSKAFYRWKKFKPENVRFEEAGTERFENAQIIPIRYAPFRLFLLSLLWRISASGIDFCQHISLGAQEEKLRRMLLAQDPGSEDQFPCVFMNVSLGDYPFLDFVDVNFWVRGEEVGALRLIAEGFAFEFFTIPGTYPPVFRHFFASKNDKVVMLFKDIRMFDDFRELQERIGGI